ncbi:hypothetical protein LU290_03370 [Moraxella nasibovis]|uniref:hypothetical protein n=1 Tax=Moraxella nasibovis TaxID=2904120 RepID=UPI00240FFB68|nr:hypothetical protein [Moraxella nasibovis]WFF39276.1 hypothetical protein LU290_03370 [Moraxella nasibovis]
MRQRFRIINDGILSNCVAEILTRKQAGEIVNVYITDKDETRSQAQNRLYWQWVHILAEKKGWSDDEMHLYLKRKFLALILARDDGEMLDTIESLKVAKNSLPPAHYERLARNVADGIRSSRVNTKQFTEYLNNIEQWAYLQGVTLPVPEDLKWVR